MGNQFTNLWTTAEDERLRELHGNGQSLHSIAAEMGRGKATVSKHAAGLGLTWDRTRTANAAKAVVADNKMRRADIVSRLYDDVEVVLDRIEAGREGQGWDTILKGEYGKENTESLPFIPSRDQRDVIDVINRSLAAATKLEAIDSIGATDLPAVDAWIAQMTGGLTPSDAPADEPTREP